MERQIDTVVASIRVTLARPVHPNSVLAAIMAASGIDGPGLARQQIASLVAWSNDPTLSEVERAYAMAQLEQFKD
jgi:hypothetical protein